MTEKSLFTKESMTALLTTLMAGGCEEEDPGISNEANAEYVTGIAAEESSKGEKSA
jgi:hypothetical protein